MIGPQITLTPQMLSGLQGDLAGANPITLLLAAEAGGVGAATNSSLPSGFPIMALVGVGAPPSTGATDVTKWYGAAFGVAAALNFSLANFNRQDIDTCCGAIATYMHSLAYLTAGPTPSVLLGNTYNYAFT
jgi:hypothetical protein